MQRILRRQGDRMGLLDVVLSLFPWEYRLCQLVHHVGAPRIQTLSGDIYCIRCCGTVIRERTSEDT